MANERTLDERLLEEGADWIAEMVSEELGGFIPSELCDLVMQTELKVRAETGDDLMDHDSMTGRIMEVFRADPEVPTQEGAVSEFIVREILHWEDEFRSMAGHPRRVRG
ncbi:MAG: hypothetical protein O2798_07265 [Chloroflexi bacterium]|nr:hypothetical protein [Chloroflexota bacterium]MDA1240627.1 hypothetical protein [Chloroflexota bacterium]